MEEKKVFNKFPKRIVIPLIESEHREIKSLAARDGVSIKKWVLDAVAQRIKNEALCLQQETEIV